MNSLMAGRIVEESTEGGNRIGLIEFGGKRRRIYLDLVPQAHSGDWVRFHAGFATERVVMNEMNGSFDKEEDYKYEDDRQEESPEEDAPVSLETLSAWRLLSGLAPEQLRKILPLGDEREFRDGEVIFHSGEKSSYLYLVVSGDVALLEDAGYPPVRVLTLGAGDALGWSALTDAGQTHFEARALSYVRTIAFRGDQLRELCDNEPALGYALMRRLLELVTERLDVVRLKLVQQDRLGEMVSAASM